jgi:tyrosyl-tRNA synthetase
MPVPAGEEAPNSALEAERLTANAVDVLPEGGLAQQLGQGRPLRVKLGIDPTTPDIHLGHTVVLSKLREFQDAGHEVVLIIGDFTARVGDPSGRSTQRPVLSEDEIAENARTYQEQAFKVLDRERTEVRANSEWLAMGADEMLALLSRGTVARLLERDIFKKRIEADEAISVLELIYPLLQGYDSVATDADVEVGGTDQKFNLLFARDVQSAYGKPQQSILTLPLLVGTDGSQKMSKSLDNYVGVTDAPQEMFGRLMRIPDELMPEYYSLLLSAPLPKGEPVEAKRELARRIVERYHDAEAAATAEEHFDRLHVRHEQPQEIEEATVKRGAASANGEVHLPALLADQFGLSRSEARRLIEQGGVRIDGEVVDGDRLDLPLEGLDGVVVQVGKRRHKRLRLEG